MLETTAIRRATRLIQQSPGLDFSVLNFMTLSVIAMLIYTGICQIIG